MWSATFDRYTPKAEAPAPRTVAAASEHDRHRSGSGLARRGVTQYLFSDSRQGYSARAGLRKSLGT